MTYQEVSDARREWRDTVRAKAFAIAADLTAADPGSDWRQAPAKDGDSEYERRPEFFNARATDERIYLSLDEYKRRISVGGRYADLPDGKPFWPRDHVPYAERDSRPSSPTMSGEKDARQIARDIVRRFLPTYRADLALYRSVCEGQRQYRESVAELRDAMARASDGVLVVGRARDPHDGLLTIAYTGNDDRPDGLSHGSIAVGNDHVRIEFSANGDFGRAFAAFLAQRARTIGGGK